MVTGWNYNFIRDMVFQKTIKMMKKAPIMFLGITYIKLASLKVNKIQMT